MQKERSEEIATLYKGQYTTWEEDRKEKLKTLRNYANSSSQVPPPPPYPPSPSPCCFLPRLFVFLAPCLRALATLHMVLGTDPWCVYVYACVLCCVVLCCVVLCCDAVPLVCVDWRASPHYGLSPDAQPGHAGDCVVEWGGAGVGAQQGQPLVRPQRSALHQWLPPIPPPSLLPLLLLQSLLLSLCICVGSACVCLSERGLTLCLCACVCDRAHGAHSRGGCPSGVWAGAAPQRCEYSHCLSRQHSQAVGDQRLLKAHSHLERPHRATVSQSLFPSLPLHFPSFSLLYPSVCVCVCVCVCIPLLHTCCRCSGRCRFHPNGRMVATTSHDETWRLWDLGSGGTCLLEQEGHAKAVHGIAFHVRHSSPSLPLSLPFARVTTTHSSLGYSVSLSA